MPASLAIAARGTTLNRSTDAGATYTQIAEVLKINRTGSKSDMADVTNLNSPNAFEEVLPTILRLGDVDFEVNFLPADATQAACLADYLAQAKNTWKIQLPNAGGNWVFTAYVMSDDFMMEPTKQITKSVKLKPTGGFTYTPSV